VLDLTRAGVAAAVELGSEALRRPGVPLTAVTLLAPLTPPSLRDFVAFEEHVEGVVRSVSEGATVQPEWYEAPTFYFGNPHTLSGSGADVAPPSGSAELDVELEVAAVIGAVPGSDGRDLTPERAAAHIFGYTILNDWSARDVQRREMRVGLGPCKGKDFASTLGPWVVTADEVADLVDDEGFLALEVSWRRNGDVVGRDLLSNMGWPFPELVAYASRSSRVVPGDVLGSGTTGSGCLAELWGRTGERRPAPLQAGETVRMDVERIGWIENRVAEAAPLPPVPPARTRSRRRTRAAAVTEEVA
jgi:2-keto-4-pentenoate hydratase/2-oxohepta-3-ene-1,7-dioic acid hydratase in catechol pathway